MPSRVASAVAPSPHAAAVSGPTRERSAPRAVDAARVKVLFIDDIQSKTARCEGRLLEGDKAGGKAAEPPKWIRLDPECKEGSGLAAVTLATVATKLHAHCPPSPAGGGKEARLCRLDETSRALLPKGLGACFVLEAGDTLPRLEAPPRLCTATPTATPTPTPTRPRNVASPSPTAAPTGAPGEPKPIAPPKGEGQDGQRPERQATFTAPTRLPEAEPTRTPVATAVPTRIPPTEAPAIPVAPIPSPTWELRGPPAPTPTWVPQGPPAPSATAEPRPVPKSLPERTAAAPVPTALTMPTIPTPDSSARATERVPIPRGTLVSEEKRETMVPLPAATGATYRAPELETITLAPVPRLRLLPRSTPTEMPTTGPTALPSPTEAPSPRPSPLPSPVRAVATGTPRPPVSPPPLPATAPVLRTWSVPLLMPTPYSNPYDHQ